MKLEEQSYIKLFSDDLLQKYGLSFENQQKIIQYVERGIKEHLYTNTNDFQHNLKHVEKVISYVLMIVNKIENTNINVEMLLTAALYHDIGKTLGASNKKHGIVGAQYFRKIMQGKMSDKDIQIICLLINQHAIESDKVDFSTSNFTEEEQKDIQLMSDILKDADALDRNRLNYPAPFGNCDINKLRTNAAKEILPLTKSFYYDYYRNIIEQKEKNSGTKIMNNYAKLEEYFENYQNGEENLIHASLDPSIETLNPRRSTQKGSYVYAGIDPTDCMKMATFRMSFLFSGNVNKKSYRHEITENFPNTVQEMLDGKFITFYRVPNEKFHEYKTEVTASPNREWVSSEEIIPLEQITFDANDLIQYLIATNRFSINYESTQQNKLTAFIRTFRTYIWGIAEVKENPEIFEQKWQQMQILIHHFENYCPNIMQQMQIVKFDIDNDIKRRIEDYKKNYGTVPNLSDESGILKDVQSSFFGRYFLHDANHRVGFVNEEYLNEILNKYGYFKQQKKIEGEELIETKAHDMQNKPSNTQQSVLINSSKKPSNSEEQTDKKSNIFTDSKIVRAVSQANITQMSPENQDIYEQMRENTRKLENQKKIGVSKEG